MEKVINRVVRRLFPELSNKLHLPQWGRVVAFPELPTESEKTSDTFYPRYAASIQLLNEHGEDADIDILEAVPLPLPGVGDNAGRLEPPAINAIVEIAFAYGRADKPFIRTVLPFGWDLPAIKEGEVRTQVKEGFYHHVNNQGDIDIVGNLHKLLVKQSQEIEILKDQLTEIKGQMTLSVTKDLIINAKNITQDADTIKLNGGTGVITCQSICPFTGSPHVDGSTTVFAGK
ncbi:MAG: hypothetical protein COB83_08795 [Gammaproteobacteria bacterium]|nr:MAG: hypothetical protein COB83_08795 [Gammaproteobacteria bacterium]